MNVITDLWMAYALKKWSVYLKATMLSINRNIHIWSVFPDDSIVCTPSINKIYTNSPLVYTLLEYIQINCT